ncbi:porin [Hoeflea sp.]|uniref:porin n=1 Tax=Hoeflea sp. TaxID=1940281 RepID=UPI003B0136E7
MNNRIDRLLPCCAAALLFTGSAHGADMIVAAEPDAVEYVRVCDAFGAGYFYIPGTETCLKLSGFVRLDAGFVSDAKSYTSTVRGRLNVQAREDTELGVLHAYVRLQGDAKPNDKGTNTFGYDGNAVIDQAYGELGGLVFGYTETTWVSSKNGGASGFGSHSDNGLSYGYSQASQIGYNLTLDGVFAAVSANDDGDRTSYVPDFTGRIGGVIAGATVYGAAGYDQSAETFGVKLGLNADIGPDGNVIVQGFYASGPSRYGANASPTGIARGTTHTPQWSVIGSYQHRFAEGFKGSVGGQYSSGYYATPVAGNMKLGDAGSGISSWAVEGVLVWNPVANVEVRGEVRHTRFGKSNAAVGPTAGYAGGDATTGLFRLQRNF